MSFERSLSIDDELTEEVNKEARVVALKALRNLVLATPVDTGRAKGNWRVGVNFDPIEEVDTKSKTGSIAIRLGQSEIASAKGQGYVDIVIANNLPYIQRLNDGWSEQAPAKFVEKAITRATK